MRTASNTFITFFIEDELMQSFFTHEIVLDLKTMIEFIDFRHSFSENKKQYWLHDCKGLKCMSKEAKDYASTYGEEFLYAGAILVHTHLQKFLINTFIAVKKPKVKTRVFTDKSLAKKWLLELKKEDERRLK